MSPDFAAPTIDTEAEQDVLCPMCDYNLRGLIDPRCPECGYTFLWIDLLDPRRRRHPYLFEHHRERNISSFLRTLVGGLRPGKFWSSLLPSQPSAVGRLRAYAIVIVLLSLMAVVAELVVETFYAARLSTSGLWNALEWTMENSRGLGSLFVITLVPPLWAFCTYWALMIFGASMEMARVNSSHVKRCIIYSLDVCVWQGLFVALAAILVPRSGWYWSEHVIPWAVLALLISLLAFAYRMCQAYRRYMQFHRPVATVFATQVMVGLIALNVLLIWLVGRR